MGSLLFFAGVDVGARTTKAVVIDGEQFIIGSRLKESRLSSAKMGAIVLDALLSELGLKRSGLSYIVGTGYGRVSLPWTHESVTEIRCHARGAHFLAITSRVANLVRKVGVIEEVAFSGGVAKIQGVRHALEQLLGVSLQSFNGIDPQLVGALGAALIARERFLVASQERLKRELVTLEVMKI